MDIFKNIKWSNLATHIFVFFLAYSGAMTALNPKPDSLFNWSCFQAGLIAAGGAQLGYRYGGKEATENGVK